jgi:hypothetical protein
MEWNSGEGSAGKQKQESDATEKKRQRQHERGRRRTSSSRHCSAKLLLRPFTRFLISTALGKIHGTRIELIGHLITHSFAVPV